MLDNLLNTVKKSAEKVHRRGEEVAHIARLKMEIFQLNRELDGHYARLGRAYHDGKDVDILSGIREDIRHTEDEIKGRERLITELGDSPDTGHEESMERAPVQGAPSNAAQAAPLSPESAAPQTGLQTNQPSASNQPPFTNVTGDKTP